VAIKEAGTRIYTAARLNRGQRGMGTTVTAAVLTGTRLLVGQVGDSRAHIVRAGELVQVTKDQSLVQQLIDAKQLTEEEAKSFDKSNIILQALGTTEEVHVDMTSVELCSGDVLVMCSDGLSGLVEPDAIRDVLLEIEDPMEACRKLTDLACDMGGDDNITVIVARFEGGALAEPTGEYQLAYERFEYPKTGEVTVRSAYPKDPTAPPEDDTEQVEQVGQEQTATAEQEQPAGSEAAQPSAADASPDAQPTADEGEEAAEEAGEEDDGEAEEGEEDGAEAADASEAAAAGDVQIEVPTAAGRKGPLIAVLAVVLVGAVIAAYFYMRGGGDPGALEASDVALPGAATAAEPASPTADSTAPAEMAAPPLAPIDEQAIIGKAKKAAKAKNHNDDTASGASAEKPEPAPPEEAPPEEAPPEAPAVEQPAGNQSLQPDPFGAAQDEQPAKKKKKKKKKKKSVIEDNPYD
jgi:protein phosphatase